MSHLAPLQPNVPPADLCSRLKRDGVLKLSGWLPDDTLEALRIGSQIDPGVPAVQALPGGLLLALKSGNFGAENFFEKALDVMARGSA